MSGRARGILIAEAAVLGLLVLLAALAVRSSPRAATGVATGGPAGSAPPRESSELAPVADVAAAAGARARAAHGPAAALPVRAQPEAPRDRAVIAVGEQEHYARFQALLAADPVALQRAAPSILLGDAPLCERVGLLRALVDGGAPAATSLLALVLTTGADERGDPFRDFALRSLAQRAPQDPAARIALREAVWGPRASPDGALRRRAAGHLAASATEGELAAGFPELAAERDALVVQAFDSALAARNGQVASSFSQ